MYMDIENPEHAGNNTMDEDLDQLNDLSLRRRAQNRISQRKHREKLRRLQEDGPNAQQKSNTKKNNELVWMQPNTISISKQKRQKASTKSAERAQSLSEEPPTKPANHTRSRAPSSGESSGSSSNSFRSQRALKANTSELRDYMKVPHDQIDDFNLISQQSRLSTPNPDSPHALILDDNYIPESNGMTNFLDDDFDMLLMQYQQGDMFQSEMSMHDHLSSSSTNSFDLQLSGQHFETPVRVDTSSQNTFGCTPLHLAVQRNHTPIVKLLLESGADVRATNDLGETALHIASKGGQLEMVSLLLDHMLDWENAQDFQGHTALHIACMEGHEDVVRLMIGRGVEGQATVGLAAPMVRL